MSSDPPTPPSSSRRPRLLFLSYFFPPVRVMACVRTWNMARTLARSGWDVTVVTPEVSAWDRVEAVAETEQALEREGIRCIRTPHPWTFLAPRHTRASRDDGSRLARRIRGRLAHEARRAARFLNIPAEAGWLREAEKTCSRLSSSEVDVILATGTPFGTFPFARRLSRRLRRPYVLDYRDLWSGHPHAERLRHVREPTPREEGRLLDESAAVMAVSPGLVRLLESRFDLGSKIHLIWNGYDAEGLSSVVPKDFGEFAIVYAGHFHPPKSVATPVMAALARLKERGSIPAWSFQYYGRHPSHVRREAARFGLEDRVVIHGEVMRKEALSAVRGAGMAVVISSVEARGSPADNAMLTGKIFEAIGLRSPLLVIAPSGSDLEAVLGVTGLGRRFSGDEIDAIASYLSDAMAGRIPASLRPDAFDWANLGRDLDGVLREVLPRTGKPESGSLESTRREAATLRP